MLFNSDYCRKHYNTPSKPTRVKLLNDVPQKSRPKHLSNRPKGLKHRDIAPISLRAITAYTRRNYRIFTVTIENIKAALN